MVTMTQKPLKHGLKVALYQPDIPQNTASIIRTCSCLGASLEIIEPCGFLFSDKRFKRVVMDYLDYSEIKFYKNPKEFFDENSKNRVVLMTTKASKVYTKFKFKRDDILLFGRESAGVPEDVHSKVNERIKIPMLKNKRSLNISISVAIGASEFIRQLG
ncbi:tRNA (cytidine(34)-2'-O)-methyltransferase [Candidatus Pelagibacter sp.]|nr:tRNA (cytidine(34)-2'-O)-methyltransferase [Candidatus Pelagibacter sp.]